MQPHAGVQRQNTEGRGAKHVKVQQQIHTSRKKVIISPLAPTKSFSVLENQFSRGTPCWWVQKLFLHELVLRFLLIWRSMGSSSDTWMREYNEALKLSEDINGMMSERNSSGLTGPDAQRRASAIRRKITILGTRLDSLLQSLLVKVPGKQQHVSEKEMNRRKDMVGNLRSKANQVASALNMSNFANRDSLLGTDTKPDDAMNRVSGMDNQGIVQFQRQVMREQDEGLEKLEETVMSTKHIALAVNEELTLQTRLIDDLDYHVDVTDSRLRRVQKSLAVMNKNMKGGCSCMSMLLSVLGIVGLALVIWLLVKYM
ncbi:Syntaxin-52 [Raphanus sativus]|nr:Syntaxin-52 [Raphanus sativus]